MSDSDSDELLTNNVFTCQNESTIVSVKGPNTNINNITGINFRNNVFSSSLQMHRPYDRHRYAASSYDQRSLSNRREISPMSVRSTCEMRQGNFAYSFKPQGMGAPRSAFNGRSGSPMSIRSIGTSASVSAVDIVQAINNEQFSKHELKVIREACNKYDRKQIRKKIDYRRYRKIHRRISGYDSGEQGSNSSVSSDDRSIRTSRYKDNMSGCRSTITDISNFRRKIERSNMFKDCTDYVRNNSIQNSGPTNWNTTQGSLGSLRSMPAGSNMSSFRNMPIPIKFNKMQEKPPVMSLKERFNNGYQLLSQRFNGSIIPTSITENVEKELIEMNPQNGDLAMDKNSKRNIESDSDGDDIFSNQTKQNQTNNPNRKRSIDSEDICLPNQKRFKTLSPCKNDIDARKLKSFNGKANDFVFTKPTCPARKSTKEKLISKSIAPLSIPQVPSEIPQQMQEKPVDEETEKFEDEQSNFTCNSTNLSMRPSFIKRKLFTQKLDVLETRDLSLDDMKSPQNSMYGAIQKEKHKARKLQQATTQSCLNRDIQQDESNLLDLIHKIVPIDQMNVTSQRNKTGSQSKNMTELENDKWDASSTISMQTNDDGVSDTYTDEMINSIVKESQTDVYKEHNTKRDKDKKSAPKKSSPVKTRNCEILLEKLPCLLDSNKQSRIKPFWETDFESDAEFQPSVRIDKLIPKENLRPDVIRPIGAAKTHDFSTTLTSKKPLTASNPSSQNYTFDTTQKFNSTLKIRSHRAPKRNKLDRTTNEDNKSVVLNTESKQKKNQGCSSININRVSEEITNTVSKKSKEPTTKKDRTTTPKGKKQRTKPDKQNQSAQKPNRNKHDSTKTEAQTNKKETNAKKQPQPLKSNSKQQDIVENNAQTKKLFNSNKKLVEPNNKSHITKKTTQTNIEENNNRSIRSCRTNSKNRTADKSNISPEENNNKTNRSIRSCRTNSKNRTADESNISPEKSNNKTNRSIRSCRTNSKNRSADKSNISPNETMNRTLRSRKQDLPTTANKNNTKLGQKGTTNFILSRLSDVSFSLDAENNTVAKRAVRKINNSRLLNVYDSDVSFSLTPTPRKTRAASRNNTTNSTPLKKNFAQTMELPISNIKSNRNRIPNMRYVY